MHKGLLAAHSPTSMSVICRSNQRILHKHAASKIQVVLGDSADDQHTIDYFRRTFESAGKPGDCACKRDMCLHVIMRS